MRWKNVLDGEVIRELSKGTRLHQEEPGGRGRQSEEREGRVWGPNHWCPHLRLLTRHQLASSPSPSLWGLCGGLRLGNLTDNFGNIVKFHLIDIFKTLAC